MIWGLVVLGAAAAAGAKVLESRVRASTEERCRAEEAERTAILESDHRRQLQSKNDTIGDLGRRLSELGEENRRLREKISEMSDRDNGHAAKQEPGSSKPLSPANDEYWQKREVE